MQSLQVFGFIWLFDKVSAELVWDISRSARFLCYQRKKELIFWARPGFKLTHLCDPSDHRRPYVAGFAPLLSKVTWNVKNSYKLCMRYWISWWLLGFFLFIILARNIDCKSILQKTLNKFGLVASKYERKSRYKSNFQCVSLRLICPSRHMFSKVRFSFAFYPGNLVFFSWNLAWNSLSTVEKTNLLVFRLNSTPIDQNISFVLLPPEVSL